MGLLYVVLWIQLFKIAVEGDSLDVTDIRLVGGSGPYEGRVEIQIDGVWGTVCDMDFHINDATVMCRMMGLLPTGFLSGAHFGQGIGPLFVQEFHCNGYESHIRDCTFEANVFCSHSRDVGIICSECGQISITNGAVNSISEDGRVLTISCNDGYQIDNNTSTCQNGSWSAPAVTCTQIGLNISDIRLSNGLGISDGRVEVLVNDIWGRICGRGFGTYEGRVICSMLGFPDVITIYMSRYDGRYYGYGSGPIYMDNIDCSGTDTHIDNCTYDIVTTCNYYYPDVAVICKYPINATDMRLVDGTGIYDGRVEILRNGIWGTVCSRYGSSSYIASDAMESLCRMLSYNLTMSFRTAIYGQGSGPILTGYLYCGGPKDNINECTTQPPTRQYCSHGYDLSLVCTPCAQPDIPYGYLYSINGTEFIAKCNNSYIPEEYKLYCLSNGTWIMEDTCSLKNTYPLKVDDIRLSSGYIPSEGRIEILVDGAWGTICDNNFSSSSANTFYTGASTFGQGTGPIYVENLICNGSDVHINNCSYNVENTCTHAEDVSVICTGYQLNITNIRLAGTQGSHHGRVEIEVNGTWGTIGDDYFSSAEGSVVCRMLGFEYYSYSAWAAYGQGSGPIYVDRLDCSGSETHINQCRYSVDNYYNKQHSEDVSVICRGYQLNITDIRLAGTSGPYHGRVEVEVNGTWGTIGDDNFHTSDGVVVCRMLGLEYYTYISGAAYGQGSGPIYVDRLYCRGSETNINECKYLVDNPYNTQHNEDVSVICFGYQLNITDIRLAGTSGPYHGRVEVEVNGTWGTIGDDNFHTSDGVVVCRMLGLEYYTYISGAAYGQGSGPIYVDRLYCSGSETNINECKYLVDNPYNTQHNEDVSVICFGYQLNITNIRLAGTSGPYHGRVELEVNGTWGTIGHDHFSSSDARVICRMLGLQYRSFLYSAAYGQGSGPIYVDRLACGGSETHINQCNYVVDNPYNTQHNEDVSVICWGPELNITAGRLANGTDPFDGRAEIKVGETWGTICDENFNIVDADVFCRLLGLKAAQYFTGAIYGEGSGPVYIDQLFCESYDLELSNCKYLFLNECTHERDVAVVCNECGQPDISYWDAGYFTYSGTTLYADCTFYRTYIGTLRLTCDNETDSWVTEGECQEYSYPLNVTDIRLAGGPRPSSGRVEIKSLDTWGTVCGDNFGMSEANVICYMMGFPPAVSYHAGAHYGTGNGPIFADDLSCGEEALDINDCTYKTYDDCSHEDDISVVCPDCGDPTPENGFINSSSTRYETAVHVTCEQDYELIDEADITCQLNGSWSSKPVCKLIDCGDATPEHGSKNATATTNGTVVMIHCEEGYNMSGEAVIVCQPDGRWTDYPSCEIIDCNMPDPENADVTLAGNQTTFGETAIITCWEGHTPSDTGSSTISCLANGNWEVWSDCIPVDCNSPVPSKGSANTTDTIYGTVVTITCPPGYNISGDSVIVCQSDGTWTDTPVCDTSDCGILSLANGEVNTTLGTTTGSIATVECNEGYSLDGPPLVICTTLGWNDSTVACKIQACDDPTPSNGKIITTDSLNGYVFRNYVEIECNVGYELKGESVITCEDVGVWSDQPSCVLRDCGHLTAPVNGSMDDSKGTKYAAQIIFSCIEGYLLVGDEETLCNENGDWTNTIPTCVKKSDIGKPCVSDAYCLFEDARCINAICTCFTGIYDETAKKCDIMPLLPYGTSEGDTSVPKGRGCGAKVTFELEFPAFNSKHTDIYICWYGFLSIDSVYANPTPPKNKGGLSSIGNRNLLAPFNAPISVLNSGAVWYRWFDSLSSYGKIKDNDQLISYIEMIVRKFGNLDSFDASFVLIVTWDKAKPLQGFDMTKTSTFQAVLISDGKTTYAFYIYGHGKMQWVNYLSNGPQVWVGYSVDTITYSHAYSFTNPVLHLDSKLSVATSENDVAGLVFKPLTEPGKKHDNHAVDCVRWYNNNYEDKKRLDFIASMTPECPCDIWLSRFDPWFWKIGLQRRRRDITYACVDMLHVGIFGHYGKRCCYDLRNWLWVYERPYAGNFQLYNPRFPLEHILNDVIPKTKCCLHSDYCHLYYELRPTGSCYKTSPYDFGTFWGDPHFRTLDGMNFTFNGLGEYVLLQVRGNKTFDLHARTERPVKEDGNLSEATIFTAFAAKDSTNASLHVELSREKKGIILYGNKVDLTNQYNESTNSSDPFEWTSDDNNLVISKRDETLSVLFPSFGISLNISVSVEMLTLNVLVNKTLKGRTQGLLGNYNGDPIDDFTLPNGTVLTANLTERDVFAYGKTWEIDANNSAFIYDKGKSHIDYHNESYVPRFLDEADPAKVAKAEKICNGSQNIQCVFDLVFTEKPEVALKTNDIKLESDTTRSELDESIPSLTGCGMIIAKKGEQVTCKFFADDNDEVYFVNNSVNATVDRESSNVVYIQENEDPVTIRFASRNTNGRSSTAVVLEILLCTNCNSHGQCTNVSRNDDRENEYYRIASCDCEPEYEGLDCENEYDGCAANPCSLNRTCIRLSAKDQKLLGRSYNCSACPDGYTVDSQDITDCLDIDECVKDTDECQHTCRNTEGSFECSCNDGYRTDIKDKSKCRDINECDEELHNCTHTCNNTEGGFICQCFDGYDIDTETGFCLQTGAGPCNVSQNDACLDTDGCTLDNGIPVCFCSDGYELDGTGKQCEDIDECSRGLCPHDCVNTDGGFECVCYPGYRLEGRTTCTECDVLHWGENCTNDCVCTGRGADRCDNVKGCVCDDGWEGDTCNNDIDECNLPIQICDDSRKDCINNLGSYSCDCKTGFSEREQGTCEDIDECADPLLNKCSQMCENTFGSYSCKCNTGYLKVNETACSDIDECELGLSQCEQICVNDPGKHSCLCNFGYTLSDNRQNCIEISDPCFEISGLTCSHFCLVESDYAQCSCRAGYRLESDNETCADINECEEAEGKQCDINANCTNTDGSFLCECPVGMQLENDGRTCSECDDYHFGKNCLQKCSCLYGTCDKKTGCVCNTGWGGMFCDTDIDECDAEHVVCSKQNTVCVNTLGSATCSCKMGYANNSGVCTDIDECSDTHLNSCDQVCNNTDGSYYCACRPGFILNEHCTDIDECAGSHGCDQVCENSAGSYKCSCEEGFALNLSDRKSCRPENECSQQENSTCPEHSTCYRKTDAAICTCLKGYQNSSTGNSCEDINECIEDINPCSENCSNTDGSFLCSCSIGKYLMKDDVTCRGCELWKHGYNCVTDCGCNKTNTNLCDPVDGQCDCKPGWSGQSCDDDIDECNEETVCPTNSTCSNSIGSFSCKCNDGYFKTGGAKCEECDTRHFGENCLQECTCSVETADDCNHVTGTCVCYEEWTGDICTVDADECEKIPDVCSRKQNSSCRNSQGSYTCECDTGFYEVSDKCEVCRDWTYGLHCESSCTCVTAHTDICEATTGDCMCKSGWNGMNCEKDIDECASEGVCPEHSTCENSEGSYDCTCDVGYTETGIGECQVCEEGDYGENCKEDCPCVVKNTETCHHVTGNCSCKIGWKGRNCSVDVDECKLDDDICLNITNSVCNNIAGSFVCECNAGYRKQNETCKDIDECKERVDNCSQYCDNTDGSYVCSCETGYKLHEDETTCQECTYGYYGSNCSKLCECNKSNTDECHHVTGNCTCKEGWEGSTCSVDIDECTANVTLCIDKANSTCLNTDGSYRCACDDGFLEQGEICTDCDIWKYGQNCQFNCTCDALRSEYCDPVYGRCTCKVGWNGTNCEDDIDECNDDESCPEFSSCNNTDGGFYCKCNKGYYKTDTESCQVCDSQHFGDNCSEECTCNTENTDRCDNVTGNCSCKQGWKGETCSIDVNECEVNTSICEPKHNSTCNNTVGSFICQCNGGFYEENENTCLDINECNDRNHDCLHTCTNTVGSYTCGCSPGYEGAGNNCTDIDECMDDPCSHICTNTNGSFVCSCPVGYKLQENNLICNACDEGYFGENCSEMCKCNTSNTVSCDHVNGNCSYIQGWNADDCSKDVNECDEKDSPCAMKLNSTCLNTDGSFSCVCNDGYKEENGICKECVEWQYGENCAFTCTCNKTNTVTCDHRTRKCTCENGWNGTECNDDINECEHDTACPANANCFNRDGSYICKCIMGHFETLDGQCQVCNDGQFGENYTEVCQCASNTTLLCDHVNGSCSCAKGWKAEDCSEDVDECVEEDSPCAYKPDSYCVNTYGSFICVCNRGYKNENNVCTVCSKNTYGENCTSHCECHVTNSQNEDQTCNTVTGHCECKPNWKGATCTEDVNECENDVTLCVDEGNKTCVNTDGWYNCDCVRGFTKSFDGSCIEDITQVTQRPVGGIVIDITVTLDFSLPAGTNLNASDTYETLRKKCVASLLDFLSDFVSESIQIIINSIRVGSLIVDYTIVYDTKDPTVASQLTKAVIDLQQGSYLKFDGQNVGASSDSYKDLEPCEVYQETIGSCGDGYSCTVENTVPVCKLVEKESDVNWSVVIGVSAAGLFILIATAILLVLIWRFAGRRKKMPHLTQRSYHNHSFNTEYDEVPDFYRKQRWQGGKVVNAGMRYPTWKSNLSSIFRSARHGNIHTFEQPYQIPRARMTSPSKDREDWFFK